MDAVLAGQGHALHDCLTLLSLAGFDVGRELPDGHGCPVILGEMSHLFSQALQLVEDGRDVLIASPQALSGAQMATLIAARKPRQAVFFWNERRHHPAYHLVGGLIRSDEAGWRPRYIRQCTTSDDRPSASSLRWLASESLALTLALAGREPERIRAQGAQNPWRGAMDFISLTIELQDVVAFVEIGLGEARRRETLLAAHDRKAYVNELDATTPVALMDDDGPSGSVRSVSCSSPEARDLARLQCLAFLEAIGNAQRCQAEADIWLSVLGCWQAAEASLKAQGLPVEIEAPAATALRVFSGRGIESLSIAPPLRIVG